MKVMRAMLAILIAVLTGCASQEAGPSEVQVVSTQVESIEVSESTAEVEAVEMEDAMRLLIGETEVPVTWEENASVEALKVLGLYQIGTY